MAQIGEVAKRITLNHASSQGSIAGVINTMHSCNTSKKTKQKKQLNLRYFQSKNKRYFQTDSHTHTLSHTFQTGRSTVVMLEATFWGVRCNPVWRPRRYPDYFDGVQSGPL